MDIASEVAKLLGSVPPEDLVEEPEPVDPKDILWTEQHRSLYDKNGVETWSLLSTALIGSRGRFETYSPTHFPVIDMDYGVRVFPSATPGHHHLYLDRRVSWYRYKRLLRALAKAGLIEKGYYKMAKKKKETFVRAPSKPKGTKDSFGTGNTLAVSSYSTQLVYCGDQSPRYDKIMGGGGYL